MSKAISLGLMAGFGWIPAVSLSEARDKAHAARQQLAGDIDPIGQFSHHAAPTVTAIASDPQADPQPKRGLRRGNTQPRGIKVPESPGFSRVCWSGAKSGVRRWWTSPCDVHALWGESSGSPLRQRPAAPCPRLRRKRRRSAIADCDGCENTDGWALSGEGQSI